MWLFTISLLTGLCAEDGPSRHDQAIAAIKQFGGVVETRASPDARLVVELTAAGKPVECMPFLKDLTNLHTLDL
jgi:hypothetical protein